MRCVPVEISGRWVVICNVLLPVDHKFCSDALSTRNLMQRRCTERRVNANAEWCFVIGQCHGNSALFWGFTLGDVWSFFALTSTISPLDAM